MGGAPLQVMDFDEAMATVMREAAGLQTPGTELLPLLSCVGRVMARGVRAERDQPPFNRSTRDGFAVRAEEFSRGEELTVAGQVRAGASWQGEVQAGQAVEIMTGAAVPPGADAVAMVEHVTRTSAGVVRAEGRMLRPGENVVPRGKEAQAGQELLVVGTFITAAEIALAAACGCAELHVFVRPRVAIVATGDELVELDATPAEKQIRNSNSYALAALVAETGGEAVRMPIARDRREDLERIIETGRRCDLLLLSGGVSMGEYDLVEEVLLGLGAEFFFTGVRMQPGKPVVFGKLPPSEQGHETYFLGLPGNPVSTQVTFHCFVQPLLRAMCGCQDVRPRFVQATLGEDVAGNADLMRILPARVDANRVRPEVRLTVWQGSGDLAANARANCYAMLPPEVKRFAAGDAITILLR